MDNLLYYDPYMLFADFAAYVECQAKVSRGLPRPRPLDADGDSQHGAQRRFSSDRTIREYCKDIWRVRPVPIQLLTQREAGSASFGAAARPHPTGVDPRP